MSKKKKANKKIRNMHGSVTLKELEDSGQVPKDFHLFDIVDMKEWQAKMTLKDLTQTWEYNGNEYGTIV